MGYQFYLNVCPWNCKLFRNCFVAFLSKINSQMLTIIWFWINRKTVSLIHSKNLKNICFISNFDSIHVRQSCQKLFKTCDYLRSLSETLISFNANCSIAIPFTSNLSKANGRHDNSLDQSYNSNRGSKPH